MKETEKKNTNFPHVRPSCCSGVRHGNTGAVLFEINPGRTCYSFSDHNRKQRGNRVKHVKHFWDKVRTKVGALEKM